MMELILYISGAIALISTGLVITRVKPVQAVLYLVVSLLAVAVIFFAAGAPLAGALEIIVYAGAIMVLFIFVLMLLNLSQPAESEWLTPKVWIVPVALVLMLIAEMVYLIASPDKPGAAGAPAGTMTPGIVPPRDVSRELFTAYLLAVELASMILLAALVAAYHLARRADGDSR